MRLNKVCYLATMTPNKEIAVKFDIEKKGYKKAQVDEYVFALKNEYESKLNDQKNRIFSLRAELSEKEKQIDAYRAKAELISSAIIQAVAKADEIEKLALARYREEIEQLRVFHEKWQAHYDKLLKKYPDDAFLKAQSKFNADLDAILSSDSNRVKELEDRFDSESERVGAQTETKTAQKERNNGGTLAENTTSSSGFSFAEAWNPTDELEKIMEDIGIVPGSDGDK